MPAKKKEDFTFSVTPELYKRSHTPASTVAMGMKFSQAASLNWAKQVAREEAIRERWRETFDPHGAQGEGQLAALQRTLSRDEARRAAYLSEESNPELHAILYGKGSSATAESAAAPATGLRNGRSAVGAAAGATAQAANVRNDRKSATRTYLAARCDGYTVPQRYPTGPMTAAQTIGWTAAIAQSGGGGGEALSTSSSSPAAAATAISTSASPSSTINATGTSTIADLFRPARHRPAVHAYHKVEDDEHATLFGYDLQPK